MRLSQAQKIVLASIKTQDAKSRDAQRVVPYLVGGAGLGKTTLITDIAEKLGIDCRIVSLAQYDAGELAGWIVPDGDAMRRVRPDWLPSDGEGILFLDELPQAPVANQNIAAQIVNERRVGDHYLPEGWSIVAAGNRTSDRAGTNTMPTHLRDRLMFLEVEADLDDTIEYYYSKGVDTRVCAFLRFRPEFLHKFDRDANACPSPRSWDRTSTILGWGLDEVCQAEAIAGQVGRPAAADFIGYLRVFDKAPDLDEIIADPTGAPIPEDVSILYAVAAGLSTKLNKSNAKAVLQYLGRFEQKEFTAFVVKDAVARDASLKQANAIRDWAVAGGAQLLI
jgi:hypothetical protein